MAKNCLRRFMLYLVVASTLVQRSSSSYDPCATTYSIGDSRRTTTEDPGTCGGLCDNYITTGNWYRLDVSNSGARMPESCVSNWHCGTYIPIWMNAAHPSAYQPGPITVPVCAPLSNTAGSCCEWQSTINVKWCIDGAVEYYVYQLMKPPFCDMAYCAGSGVNCGNSGSWNDITQNCTTQYPISATPSLSDPYISKTAAVTDTSGKPFTATTFSLKCTLNYTPRTTDDGSRYDVVFDTDGGVVYTKTLLSTDTPVVVLGESYLAGHIDQNVFCRVTSYWQSAFPKRSAYINSSSVYIGFRFQFFNAATNIEITQPLSVNEGDKVKVNVLPKFPITTPACVQSPGVPCSPSYSFRVNTQQLYVSTCSISVPNGATTSFVFSPIANVGTTWRGGSFSLSADNTLQAQGSILNGYRSQSYPVSINEGIWKTCVSCGDPHITTYFRNYFHIYDAGQYILTSIPSRRIEVQVSHYQCGSTVTCNCGVIAREGNNMIGIDNCSPRSSTAFIRYLKDVNNPGGYIYSNSGGSYNIVLPSGMIITVDVYGSPGWINVNVQMYGVDADTSSRDLCSNSLTNQYTQCGNECNRYRVSGTNFFGITNSMSTPPCINDAILVPQCDCTNGGTTGSSCPTTGNNAIPIYEYSNTCSQPLSSRRRRADNTNQATTAVMPSGNVNRPTLVWPTPNKQITQKMANDACTNALQNSSVYALCINEVKVNVSTLIQSCVVDIQIMEDFVFPTSYVASGMEIQCKALIDGTTDPILKNSYLMRFGSQICPNQCSGRGTCNNGVCNCNAGYQSNDCSVMAGAVPKIVGLPSSTCDIRVDTTYGCTVVYVWASDVTNTLKCKITDAAQNLLSIDVNPYVNTGFVLCHLPDLPVSLGASQNRSFCSYSINVALSNDGTNYGNSVAFKVLDSKCSSNSCEPTGQGTDHMTATKCCATNNIATVFMLIFALVLHELLIR